MRDTIRLIFAEGQRFTQVAGNNDSESRFLGHSNTVNFLRGTAALEKQCSVYSLIALSGVELVKKIKTRAQSITHLVFSIFFFFCSFRTGLIRLLNSVRSNASETYCVPSSYTKPNQSQLNHAYIGHNENQSP